MKELRKTFCRYDMVCDDPKGAGLEIYRMPEFFSQVSGLETDKIHVHGFYEIVWFTQGEGVHYVDFSEYPVSNGTMFFISPGQVHSFDKRHDQKGYVIKVCSELLADEVYGSLAYLIYNIFNAYDRAPFCRLDERDNSNLSYILDAAEAELKHPGSLGHEEYLQSLVRLFLITVQRAYVSDASSLFNPVRTSHRYFLSFRRLLDENYTTVHTVKEYASMLNITSKTLTQYVGECSTQSPLNLINNRIILEAKRLLRYSNFSVKEIAFRLGFEDPSYFVKFFKRLVHRSPADYRESI